MDKDILEASASRRTILKTLAAAGAGVALGGAAFPLAAHAATDDPPAIIGVALAAEYLAVTFQTNALAAAAAGQLPLRPDEVTTIQAVAATEAIHVAYLQAYGAVSPIGGSTGAGAVFTFPAGTFTSRSGYATTAIILETAFVAAYMAATREFAADARADLAQLAYQFGAVEAEHRALSRAVLGAPPYSDVAFELNLVPSVAAAAGVLANLGFLTPQSTIATNISQATATAPITLQYTTANQQQALGYANLLSKTTPA